MANKPKVQQDDVPPEGVSPDTNPEGRTPHGIPQEMNEGEPEAKPTNDRLATETAALNIEQDKPPPPKR